MVGAPEEPSSQMRIKPLRGQTWSHDSDSHTSEQFQVDATPIPVLQTEARAPRA